MRYLILGDWLVLNVAHEWTDRSILNFSCVIMSSAPFVHPVFELCHRRFIFSNVAHYSTMVRVRAVPSSFVL
jgi:hypothetical protein